MKIHARICLNFIDLGDYYEPDMGRIPWSGVPDPIGGLSFSLLKDSDFDSLYAVACDPAIWEQHPDKYRYEVSVFRKFFENALTKDCTTYLLSDSLKNCVIGSSRFYRFGKAEDSVFVGFTFLAKDYWGGIWNARLKLAMLSHAFQHCKTVYFEAGAQNQRSVSALQKLGAKKLTHPQDEKVLFQINQEIWPAVRRNLQAKLRIENRPDISIL